MRDDIEQILDEALLRAGVALDGLERPGLGRLVQAAGAQQRDPAEDRIEGRAQLVRHGREELVLQAAELLGVLAEQPLARERGARIGFAAR